MSQLCFATFEGVRWFVCADIPHTNHLTPSLLKQDLREQARLSSTSMARLNNGENVTTDTLLRICQVLECQIGDIVEVTHITHREAGTCHD